MNNSRFMRVIVWIGIGTIVVLSALSGVGAWLDYHAYSLALKAFRESRSSENRVSDYDIVARGIVEGMSFDEVRKCFNSGRQLHGLFPNRSDDGRPVSDADDRDAWLCLYQNVYTERLGIGRWSYDKIYIMETYWVVFDNDRRAVHINYDVVGTGPGAGHGNQKIRVNLHEKTISEPLRLEWRG